ncbi:MAG TPA: uroporphyrinogen-III synthase [Candidatus Krumholzibacteria bacterium]|jgi:uroporphyrinogen-III synthase
MRESPLRGLSVWVTRPEPENERSAAFWRAAGADVAMVPFLVVVQEKVPADEIDLLEADPPDHVVFTSARAVEKLLVVLHDRPHLAAQLKTLPTWTVGEKTLEAAREAGFLDLRRNPGQTAQDLAEHMTRNLTDRETVLFPAAKQRRPELPRVMAAAKIPLIEWTVYDSVRVSLSVPEHRARLHGASPPLLLLYSPTAARAAARIVGTGLAQEVPVATLGDSTRATAEEWNLRVVASAHLASEESLLESLSAWWSEQLRGEA